MTGLTIIYCCRVKTMEDENFKISFKKSENSYKEIKTIFQKIVKKKI